MPRRRQPARQLFPAVLAALVLIGCTSNRPAVAIKATVETFYAAIATENVSLIDDNLAPSAASSFRDRVMAAAVAAQESTEAQKAVQTVRVDQPAIRGDTAKVHVVLADGTSDDVLLARQGFRWRVVTSTRLG